MPKTCPCEEFCLAVSKASGGKVRGETWESGNSPRLVLRLAHHWSRDTVNGVVNDVCGNCANKRLSVDVTTADT